MRFLLFLLITGFDSAPINTTKGNEFIDYLGSIKPYIFSNKVTPVDLPRSCELKQIHLLSRHAQRFATRGKMEAMNALASFTRNNSNEISDPALQRISRMQWDMSLQSQLLPTANQTILAMVDRLRVRYNTTGLFDSTENLFVQSTDVQRVIETTRMFTEGMYGESTGLKTFSLKRILDADLTPFASCTAYAKTRSKAKSGVLKKTEYTKIAQRLSSALKLPLSTKHVQAMLSICGELVAMNDPDLSVCEMFTLDEFKKFEFVEDTAKWEQFGPTVPIRTDMTCSLFAAIHNNIMNLVRNKYYHPVSLRFGHAETILPFHAALGDYAISQAQEAPVPEWRVSDISPFLANVIFEVAECSTGTRLRMLVNEQVKAIPGCSMDESNFCSLQDFEKLYGHLLQCNFDKMCGTANTTVGGWNDFWSNATHVVNMNLQISDTI